MPNDDLGNLIVKIESLMNHPDNIIKVFFSSETWQTFCSSQYRSTQVCSWMYNQKLHGIVSSRLTVQRIIDISSTSVSYWLLTLSEIYQHFSTGVAVHPAKALLNSFIAESWHSSIYTILKLIGRLARTTKMIRADFIFYVRVFIIFCP